jgi:hypothetical protein
LEVPILSFYKKALQALADIIDIRPMLCTSNKNLGYLMHRSNA